MQDVRLPAEVAGRCVELAAGLEAPRGLLEVACVEASVVPSDQLVHVGLRHSHASCFDASGRQVEHATRLDLNLAWPSIASRVARWYARSVRTDQQASDPLLRRMTLDEWADLPEDEEGELVDGWLVEEEVPDFLHEAIVAWLLAKLVAWTSDVGGIAGGSDAKFAVASDRGRKPDITVFVPGRMPPRRGLVRVPPEIAVEIVSTRARDRRRDRVEKSAEYAAFGIPWYWIVDPEPLRLEIHRRRDDGSYIEALAASAGVLRDVPGCPGLVLDLDELHAYVARLTRDE